MKGDHQVIAAVMIFFAGIFFNNLVTDNVILSSYNDYISAVSTMFAAFLGAGYAFKLQSNKEERKIQETNKVAGNLAIFNTTRMLNILLDYQKQIIDPVRGKELDFIEMQPTLPLDDEINLDLGSLAFLLDTDDLNFLGELWAEESKFRRTINAINLHSQLHIHKLQPAFEQANIKEGHTYPLSEFERVLGIQLFTTMRQSTQQIIDSVDSNVSSIQKTSEKLTQIMKKMYPSERLISLKIQNDNKIK